MENEALVFKSKYMARVSDSSTFASRKAQAIEMEKVERLMKPIMYLFFMSGIDLKKKGYKGPVIIFSIFFHFMCLGIIIFKIVCLAEDFVLSVLVSMSMKATALLLWWAVCLKRRNFLPLMQMMKLLCENTGIEDYEKLLTLSKVAASCVVFIICCTPALLALRYFGSKAAFHNCIDVLPSHRIGSTLWILLHEFATVFVNVSITYPVALFYSIYCITLFSCLKRIRMTESESWKVYKQTLEIFRSIESVLSVLILIVFAHVLTTLFKDMEMLIMIFKVKKIHMVYFYLLDFTINSLVMCIIVFSVDMAQKSANAMRESFFLLSPLYDQSSLVDLNRRYIKLGEDRKRLKLSAWGMFDIKKPLIINILTFLITYGVIILQFS